jgi:hypothetical protein
MGFNPIKFDKVIASIMGFDYRKIPTIIKASSINNKFKVDDDTNYIVTVSNSSELNNVNGEKLRFIRSFGFEPTSGWKGHIEIK